MNRIVKIITKLFCFTFVAALAFSSCSLNSKPAVSCSDKRVYNFPLTYSPTEQLKPNWTVMLGEQKLYLKPVIDARNTESINVGKNVEKNVPYLICTSKNNAADFVSQAFQTIFSGLGINLVDQIEEADLIVQITLKDFWVVEGNDYLAKLNTIVDVTDQSKKVLWRGPIFEGSKDWGRSLTAEFYNQSLSNATLKMVQNLINNPAFKEVIGAK